MLQHSGDGLVNPFSQPPPLGLFESSALLRNVDIYSLDPDRAAIERLRTRLQLGDKAQV